MTARFPDPDGPAPSRTSEPRRRRTVETERATSPAAPPDTSPALEGRVLLVHRRGRPIGVVLDGDDLRWQDFRPPAAGQLLLGVLIAAGATAVGLRWAGRPAAGSRIAVGRVTMGPGGWVSVKGTKPPVVPGNRPWWAKLLRAYRL